MSSLDITARRAQKHGLLSATTNNFYAEWRVRCGVAPALREDVDSPPERLLQAVWQHQRLLRDRLRTFDGQPVKVLHPGFLNREGGPDFRGAVVQFGDAAARTGDVEVDLRSSGWHAHGHDRNPAFGNVVLHVIWESEQSNRGAPPLLVLRNVLDAPIGELSLWLGAETMQSFPAELRGCCCAPLCQLDPGRLTALLHQAAQVRLRSKAEQFQARARQVGWEQSLWEGLFRALGYKHNVWPMQRIAELRPRWLPAQSAKRRAEARQADGRLGLEARLLGISNLLPAELTRTQAATDTYLRRTWDLWWRERDEFLDCILPRAVWHLHGLRPANHPQRRLALAAAWAIESRLDARLEEWCGKEITDHALSDSLLELLQVPPDEFWSWHWTLKSARRKNAQPLLGITRVTDLAVNVALPWLWARAIEGKNVQVQQRLEKRYHQWPPAEDNSVLRLARNRLLGGASARSLPGAAAQQGLIQIVRDFCDHSNAVCENCKLPELVKEFRGRE
ncbi:MAG TPA: DUF2851 family protein [Verrucomicrobiae bacterium]